MHSVKTSNIAVELTTVVYDKRARDGTWCRLPYPRHPNGCPKYPKCICEHEDFKNYVGYMWFAVVEDFDWVAHQRKMKSRHPNWSENQCKCVLYWQGTVRRKLREKAKEAFLKLNGGVILTVPEANGINVFATMAKAGLVLLKNPTIVHKIMLIGCKA